MKYIRYQGRLYRKADAGEQGDLFDGFSEVEEPAPEPYRPSWLPKLTDWSVYRQVTFRYQQDSYTFSGLKDHQYTAITKTSERADALDARIPSDHSLCPERDELRWSAFNMAQAWGQQTSSPAAFFQYPDASLRCGA